MKEKITLRLYENKNRCAACATTQYTPSEDVRGWDYSTGDQIGLSERTGGYLMAGLDEIGQEILEDETGRYKLATAWTMD